MKVNTLVAIRCEKKASPFRAVDVGLKEHKQATTATVRDVDASVQALNLYVDY